jgi:hypothetical protein
VTLREKIHEVLMVAWAVTSEPPDASDIDAILAAVREEVEKVPTHVPGLSMQRPSKTVEAYRADVLARLGAPHGR